MKHIGRCFSISLPIPDLDEQLKISEFLKLKSKEFDILVTKYQQEIELLKEYKRALISEVITGKIDVREEMLNYIDYEIYRKC